MAGVVAPYVEAAGNLFGVEDVGHLLINVAADVVDGSGKNAGIAAIEVEVAGIVHVRHVMGGQVEVAILIVVTGEEARGVEGSSHGKDVGEDGRMAEGDVDGMIAAKAATDGGQAGHSVAGADERNNFIAEILLVAEVAGDSGAGNDGAVVPAFGIDGIDAEELELATLKFVLNGADHAIVFKVEKASARGGKGERGGSRMPEDEQFHLPPESGRQPLVIFTVHWAGSIVASWESA